jgi:DNA-binding NarL/FixJ family response regulator
MALRCLIVDDNAGFLAVARDVLGRQGISVVGVASSGAEALERLHELHPDVTLIDVDLGDESGFDVAHRFSERERVVLISTYAERDFTDLIEASDALGFLSKSQLSGDAIRDLLGRSA